MNTNTSSVLKTVPLRRLNRAALGSRYDAVLTTVRELAARAAGPDAYGVEEKDDHVVVHLPDHANALLFSARAIGAVLGLREAR